MEKTKIAIVGVGNISQEHIAAYKENAFVELYAFCDINKARLEEMGKKYNITRLYTSEDKMLEELPEIDGVDVCTWNSAHAECTIKALEAGKDVLCEKPMATTVEEAEKMLEVSKKCGKLLQIGFVCRFGDDCKIIEDYRDNGFFGDIYYAKASFLRRHGNPGGWFCDTSYSAGGPMIDLGVHIIDLTRFLMGNPKPVSVYGATFKKLLDRPGIKDEVGYKATSVGEYKLDVEDLATAMIRYENGAVLQVETSYSLNIKEDVYSQQLFGTEGGVELAPNFELYKNINGYMTNVTLSNGMQYKDDSKLFVNEMAHFVDCIRNNTPCRAPAEDGIDMMKILKAIYKSAETGHEVVL